MSHPHVPPARPKGGGSGVVGSALHAIASGLSHVVGAVTGLPADLGMKVAEAIFDKAASWAAGGAAYVLGGLGTAMSATTRPEIGTTYFTQQLGVMSLLGAAVALPLLLLTAIQAVVQQDAGLLVRALLVRLPLALALTGVAIQLVALGMAATDSVSSGLMHAASVPAGHVFAGLAKGIVAATALGVPVFATFVLALVVAFGALVLWLELALRAASIEVATLFLPLALAGVIWPATSQWARRLGETLAALILSKVVIVAVLALAVGELASVSGGGLSAVVSGIALLLLAVFSPYAVFRLVPVLEAGAVGHLQGLAGHKAVQAARQGASLAKGALSGDGVGGSTGASDVQAQPGIGSSGEAGVTVTEGGMAKAMEKTSDTRYATDTATQQNVKSHAEADAAAGGIDPRTAGADGAGGGGASAGAGGAGGGAAAGGAGAGAGGAGTAGAGAAGAAAAGVAAARSAAGTAGAASDAVVPGAAAGGSAGGGDGRRDPEIAAPPHERQGSWPPPVAGEGGLDVD